jgi:hypothetical protein
MDSEIQLIQLIENDDIDETILFPIIISSCYMIVIHLLFYQNVNDEMLCCILGCVLSLLYETYKNELK